MRDEEIVRVNRFVLYMIRTLGGRISRSQWSELPLEKKKQMVARVLEDEYHGTINCAIKMLDLAAAYTGTDDPEWHQNLVNLSAEIEKAYWAIENGNDSRRSN